MPLAIFSDTHVRMAPVAILAPPTTWILIVEQHVDVWEDDFQQWQLHKYPLTFWCSVMVELTSRDIFMPLNVYRVAFRDCCCIEKTFECCYLYHPASQVLLSYRSVHQTLVESCAQSYEVNRDFILCLISSSCLHAWEIEVVCLSRSPITSTLAEEVLNAEADEGIPCTEPSFSPPDPELCRVFFFSSNQGRRL